MLIRAISGFLNTPQNSVIIDENATMGIIIENPEFINSFSGFDNLKYLASITNRIGNNDIFDMMKQVLLDPNDKRPIKHYSLGMKQKLAIAQAIMESPDILLLDEPTRGLDEESVDNIHRILKAQQEKGCTIIISSHNKEDIKVLYNEVYKIVEGKIENYI